MNISPTLQKLVDRSVAAPDDVDAATTLVQALAAEHDPQLVRDFLQDHARDYSPGVRQVFDALQVTSTAEGQAAMGWQVADTAAVAPAQVDPEHATVQGALKYEGRRPMGPRGGPTLYLQLDRPVRIGDEVVNRIDLSSNDAELRALRDDVGKKLELSGRLSIKRFPGIESGDEPTTVVTLPVTRAALEQALGHEVPEKQLGFS